MMKAINQRVSFGGAPRVTVLHVPRRQQRAEGRPELHVAMRRAGARSRRARLSDRLERERRIRSGIEYIQAIGGADRLARLTSYSAKGTYSGFDTDRSTVPIELYAKAPNQETVVVHLTIGASTRVFDGQNAWVSGPEQPLPLLTLTGGNVDRARLSALANFRWACVRRIRSGAADAPILNDKDVIVLQATVNGDPRRAACSSTTTACSCGWCASPSRRSPSSRRNSTTPIIGSCRVSVSKCRSRGRLTQTYMQMTLQFTDVQPNAPIDAARFARPAPAKLQSEK